MGDTPDEVEERVLQQWWSGALRAAMARERRAYKKRRALRNKVADNNAKPSRQERKAEMNVGNIGYMKVSTCCWFR